MALETDPRDLLLGDDNDLVITTDLSFTKGIPAVVQSARIALQMYQGEWFLDLDAGIPYWDNIMGQKPDLGLAVARAEFRRELLEVESVEEIVKLDVTYDRSTREMSVDWQVRCEFGETPVDTLTLEIA